MEGIRPNTDMKSNADSQGQEDEMEQTEENMQCTICNVEELKMKIVRNPGSPTAEEKERHDMTHNPYRSWCPVCVEAKGREDPHFRGKGEKREGVNVIGMDYKSFGQDDNQEKMTILIMR